MPAARRSGEIHPAQLRAPAVRTSANVLELGTDHPQLLLERAGDVDQDVLRGEVDLAEPLHPLPCPLVDGSDASNQLADRH